jgi:hypothetical protein
MPVIPALRRLRQEDHKSKTNLGCTARSCLKRERKKKKGKTKADKKNKNPMR